MAAPTQALPSWLTVSTQLITQPGGGVITSTTLLELPLTYFGPSIPLGTNGVWTWGGLTSPASTSTASTATATPSSSPSTITSTSSPITSSPTTSPSTTATPTSSSVSSSSSIQSTFTTTVFATPSSAGIPTSGNSLSKGAIIGIILGSILGTLLLLLLALILLRWRRKRQNGAYQTPMWTGWEIVDPTPVESQVNGNGDGGDRPPGEGSPRVSGEEADSLLRRSRATANGEPTTMANVGMRLVTVPAPAAVAGATAIAGAALRAAASGSNSGTNHSGGSAAARTESTAVSDYGILLHGGYTDDPDDESSSGIPARPSTDMGFIGDSRRHIIPPSELLRIERERLEQEQLMHNEPSTSRVIATVPEDFSPLSPPPIINPDRGAQTPSSPKASSSAMSGQSGNEQDDPMVLTARRVRLSQLGPRSQPELRQQGSRAGSGIGGWGSLGIGGIARLSRLSWFKKFREDIQDPYTSPRSRHASRPSSWVARPLSEHDVEAGHALLDDDLLPPRALGKTAEGERPRSSSVSGKSAVSGNTVYHDADSTIGTSRQLPSLPRAYISSGPTGASQSRMESTEPPLYESEQATKDDDHAPRLVDILDTPAPTSVSQFSSASSRSVRFPPGLVTMQSPRSWYGSSSSDGDNAGITIDVLEDTPPRAGDGWRAMARDAHLTYPLDHRSSFRNPTRLVPPQSRSGRSSSAFNTSASVIFSAKCCWRIKCLHSRNNRLRNYSAFFPHDLNVLT